jgi:RecJ-like exonuclease
MPCPDCDGFGEVEMLALDATRPAIVLCDCCEGSGEVPATCHRCEGVLVSGYCADCDENLSEPESVAVAFARLFNPPILEVGVVTVDRDGTARIAW